ncbi:MAG: MATE family efflux transporter [Chloroflexi bacterium]|nr:MATE family efflux transporter [Chloroflexota bacterium]
MADNKGLPEPLEISAGSWEESITRSAVSRGPGFFALMLMRFAPTTAPRRVLALAWPSVLEQTLLTMVGLVDTYIVGHLGAQAIAGVGLGGQVLNLSTALFSAVGVGATALVARSIGARDEKEANALAEQSVLIGLALGAIVSALVFAFAAPIIRALGAEEEVVRLGSTWLRIVAPSFIFIGLVLVGGAILRGAGDMRASLWVMTLVNIVNITLALSLTRGFFGLPKLGVVGTGIGASAGQIAGGILILAMLLRGRAGIRLARGLRATHLRELRSRAGGARRGNAGAIAAISSLLRPDLTRIRRVLSVGLPAGAEQMLLQLALLNMAGIVTRFGTEAYAAHQITIRLSSLSYLPGWGFSVAATTLVGQELGARRPDRARSVVKTSWALALAVMTILGGLIFAFDGAILRLFTDDAAVIAAGIPVLRISALAQPLLATAFVFSGALRGAGDTRATMVITIASIWGLRLVLAYLLGIVFGLGLIGAWLAFSADFGSRALFFWLRFRAGKWQALRV